MYDRKCSFCGISYNDEEGHDYDKCVQRCDENVKRYYEYLQDAIVRFTGAREVQGQYWWRRGVDK